MANWNGWILTTKGRALQAKVEVGTELEITKMKLGSGVLSEGETLEDLTDLIKPEQILGIAAKEVMKNEEGEYTGLCKISSTISNAGLTKGYEVRELGVFAQDPDDGEILYAITTDSAPDYLPPEGGATVISQEFSVYIAISNADHITAEIDPGALATMRYVGIQIDEHNNRDDAHELAFTEKFKEHNADTEAHADFMGATAEKAGVRGMVPAPPAGAQNKVLTGAKIWSLVEELNVALENIAAPEADTAALKTLLGGIAYVLKEITGESDWKGNPKINLATLFTLVGNLSSGSDVTWDGQKFTNAKLGVSGLMAQNGYIQFGKNFGGLIVQWGFITQTGTDISIPFPVSFSELLSIANAGSYTWNGEDNWITKSTANGFTASHEVIKVEFRWIAIGR